MPAMSKDEELQYMKEQLSMMLLNYRLKLRNMERMNKWQEMLNQTKN
jgi:hypothetical protein